MDKKYVFLFVGIIYSIVAPCQNLDSLNNEKGKIFLEYNSLKPNKFDANEKLLEKNKEKSSEDDGLKYVIAGDTSKLFFLKKQFQKLQREIYKEDDRKEISQVTKIYNLDKAKIGELSKSGCAIIHINNLEKDGHIYRIKGSILIESKTSSCKTNFCSNLRFKDQVSSIFGTGFIISGNRIITAEHCVFGLDLSQYRIITEYTSDTKILDAKNVYSITGVINKKAEHTDIDFAILKVDRNFPTQNAPLTINSLSNLKNSDGVFMIGFPSGLPMKVTDNATVYGIKKFTFYSNLDAFKGNSGSPVFNSNGEVEGILISGASDYTDGNQNCCTLTSYPMDIDMAGEKEVVLRLNFISKISEYFTGQ